MARTGQELDQYIREYVDVDGELEKGFLRDGEAQQDIDGYAKAVKAELDDVWADEGGCKVTADEFSSWFWMLAERKADDEAQ
jgi:hypothetical protein